MNLPHSKKYQIQLANRRKVSDASEVSKKVSRGGGYLLPVYILSMLALLFVILPLVLLADWTLPGVFAVAGIAACWLAGGAVVWVLVKGKSKK